MASQNFPKKEDQGKDMQKLGALDARVTELCASLQETMAQGETSGQESSVTGTPPTGRRTVPSRSAPYDGIDRWESYCLLVQVVKDALRLSEWDVWVPTHAWDENIAADICESRIGCLPRTYKVQLLSDTEFLLRKRPTSGPEMNWQDVNTMIRLIHGEFLWCGVPVSLAARHCTKKEAKYDLDATFAYQHTRAQEQVALSKFQKDSKRSVIIPKEPQSRGRGMTHCTDKHLPKRWQEDRNRSGRLSMLLPEVRTGTIQPGSPRILTTIPRRNNKMWSPKNNLWSNPTSLTPALSGLAVLPFIASIAQWRIGTGREPEGD